MRQENSVLFALADLRGLEAERCENEQRLEEQRRLADEARRRAEEAERAAEEQRRQAAEAQRLRTEEERLALASALRETSARNHVLESDVQQLRALVAAATPASPHRRSRWPFAILCIAVAAIAIVISVKLQTPVRERVVYVTTPPPVPPSITTAPAVSATPPPATKVEPARPPVRTRRKSRPHVTSPTPTKPPTVDDCNGKDPLCGTEL